jgi:TonB family protein
MMIAFALALAVQSQALTAPAGPAALTPTGPWKVLSEPTMYTLSRDYEGVSFAISSMPVAGDVEMAFVGEKVSRKPFGDTNANFLPSHSSLEVRFRGNTMKGSRLAVLWFRVSDESMAKVDHSETMWVDGGGALVPRLRVTGFDRALRALRDCENTIASGLGVDTAALARIATPAKELMKPNFIPPRDYPKDAIDASASGEARLLWTIGADGKVSDCRIVRSAGFPALDRASCAGVEQHARYEAARDAAGQPVPSWRTARIKWALRH